MHSERALGISVHILEKRNYVTVKIFNSKPINNHFLNTFIFS